MSDIILGRDLIVAVDDRAIAAAKSCQVRIRCEAIEVSSPTRGRGREYRAGRMEWEVSVGTLVTAIAASASMVGKAVTVAFGIRDEANADSIDADERVSGRAIVTEWDSSGAVGNIATGSFKFRGNGELSIPE